MNRKRRTQIRQVYADLVTVKDNLKDILRDEEDYYDNIPDNLSESDRANESEEAIDNLDDSVECIGDAIDSIKGSEPDVEGCIESIDESLSYLDEVV